MCRRRRHHHHRHGNCSTWELLYSKQTREKKKKNCPTFLVVYIMTIYCRCVYCCYIKQISCNSNRIKIFCVCVWNQRAADRMLISTWIFVHFTVYFHRWPHCLLAHVPHFPQPRPFCHFHRLIRASLIQHIFAYIHRLCHRSRPIVPIRPADCQLDNVLLFRNHFFASRCILSNWWLSRLEVSLTRKSFNAFIDSLICLNGFVCVFVLLFSSCASGVHGPSFNKHFT